MASGTRARRAERPGRFINCRWAGHQGWDNGGLHVRLGSPSTSVETYSLFKTELLATAPLNRNHELRVPANRL